MPFGICGVFYCYKTLTAEVSAKHCHKQHCFAGLTHNFLTQSEDVLLETNLVSAVMCVILFAIALL